MAKKYNFSIQISNPLTARAEIFQVEGCDSFDEAIKIVEKGVYDRMLEIKKSLPKEPVTANITAAESD